MKINFSIPFPAYEAIAVFNRIAEVLHTMEEFGGIWSGVPRRIQMKPAPAPAGADQAVRITIWFEGGTYAHLTMQGEGWHGTTQWYPVALRVRWKAMADKRFDLSFNQKEIEALLEAAGGLKVGRPLDPSLSAWLAELGKPVRLEEERARIAHATHQADWEGRPGHWLEDRRPFGPILPPSLADSLMIPPVFKPGE